MSLVFTHLLHVPKMGNAFGTDGRHILIIPVLENALSGVFRWDSCLIYMKKEQYNCITYLLSMTK